jgi:glycosidase
MYQVFVRNFSKEGTFNALTGRLNDIKSLGANTLWLMPIQPTGIEKHKGTYGSPYAIKDYADVHPDYGTKADFKRLVDSCHALGLNIIIDMVANHTAWDHPWVKAHPDWYVKDSTGAIIPPVADWTDVADLNFDNKEMRKALLNDMLYWIKEFDIDGYRCDVAEMVPNDFWKPTIDSLNKVKPVIMLAEGAKPDLYDAGFQITYGWDFYHNLKQVFNGKEPLAKLDSVLAKEKVQYPAGYKHIRFITNHDENSWDDVPQNKFVNLDGTKAAFVISACIGGVPFVYNGQEVGYPEKINLFEKYNIDYNANPELSAFYKNVLNTFNNSDALQHGTLTRIDTKNKDVYAFIRESAQEKVMVVVNVRNKPASFTLPKNLGTPPVLLMGTGIDVTTSTLPAFAYSINKL